MKVLHLTGKDYFGAGRAAYRLHKGLLKEGVESLMFVGDKHTNDDTVLNVQNSLLHKFFKKVLIKLEKHWLNISGERTNSMFSSGIHGFSLAKKVNAMNPDIIHVHWINRGYMKLNEILKMKAPVVITMHDVWYFTGGCHYTKGCSKFTNKCGKCPQLNSNESDDISTYIQSLKKNTYKKKKIHFIAPSHWMKSEAERSSLLKDQNVHHLSNGIDAAVFSYQTRARARFDFSQDKKLVLYAAVDATSDDNKGFKLLNEAIHFLDKDHFELVVIGGKKEDAYLINGIKIHNVGYIGDDKLLIDYLSASDVVVVPSKHENLSNLIMESLSCSKPVVAFNIGGNSDMITHEKNGYLAKPFDSEDLANGLRWCVNDEDRNAQLSANARQTIEEQYSIDRVSKSHLDLYSKIIEGLND
nr:glycosyltransferase [uncultured Carboxylicivirga sp.]